MTIPPNVTFASKFALTDRTRNSSNSQITYTSYVAKDGSWYILKQNNADGTYRYVFGISAYTTNWGNRESLTYGYYYEL